MQNYFDLYKDHTVDPATQQRLNQPVQDGTGFNPGHEEFLRKLMALLSAGTLNPLMPQTLYNAPVYQALSEREQEAADLAAVNLMSLIRQIEALWKAGERATFQIQNLVEAVFQKKSAFEEKHGNVYII